MVKITGTDNRQVRLTVPIALANALDLKVGDEVDLKLNGRGRIEIVKLCQD